MIELGRKVKDKVTGFAGVTTGFVTYITGCNQALVAAPSKDGKPGDTNWFDEQRLEYADDGKSRIVLDNSKTPGFDYAAPVR